MEGNFGQGQGKGPLFFSKNYFHVGTTVPLKAAQVALNLARVFPTIKNKQKVFAGLTSPIFFEFWQNFAQFFWSLLRVIQILWQNNLGVAMWVFAYGIILTQAMFIRSV